MDAPRRTPCRGLDHVERATCFVMAVAMAVLVVGVNAQVIARCLLCYSLSWGGDLAYLLSWGQELVQYTFVWMIVLGAGVGVRRGLHLRIDFLDSSLGERGRRRMAIVVDLACSVLAVVFLVAGAIVAWRTRLHASPAVGLPMGLVYAVFPLSGLTLLAFLAEAVVRGRRPVEANEPREAD